MIKFELGEEVLISLEDGITVTGMVYDEHYALYSIPYDPGNQYQSMLSDFHLSQHPMLVPYKDEPYSCIHLDDHRVSYATTLLGGE